MTRIARKGFALWLSRHGLVADQAVALAARAYSVGATTPELVDVEFARFAPSYRADLRRAVRRYGEYQADERAKRAGAAEVAA